LEEIGFAWDGVVANQERECIEFFSLLEAYYDEHKVRYFEKSCQQELIVSDFSS
jgi:hypothetical protein